jgi:hypothetical protein
LLMLIGMTFNAFVVGAIVIGKYKSTQPQQLCQLSLHRERTSTDRWILLDLFGVM